jgi:hypothetical protein
MEKDLKLKDYADVEMVYNTWVQMDLRDRLHIYMEAKAETGIEHDVCFNWLNYPKLWGKYRVQKYKNKFIDFLFPTYEYKGSKGVIIFAYLCNGNWKKRLKNLTVLEKEFISKLNRLLNDKI